MNDEQLVEFMKKLGYKSYIEGNKKYFLPIKSSMKWQTPLTYNKLRDIMDLPRESFVSKVVQPSTKKPRGWNLKKK